MEDRTFQLQTGELFAGFRIVSELGRGNNGVVYLAKQEMLDREVALKLLLPELSGSPEYVKMLMLEAHAAARLNHPNIVQALDAGSERDMPYLAMEYVRGRTLEDIRLNSPEELSTDFLIDTVIQLADALDYAWENFSMIHGDVKPENFLICNDTKALKIADLGLSHISGRISSDDGSFMATPMYVAPEVISGDGQSGVAGDIYSCGVMLYELIAGKPPFNGDTEHLLHCHLEEEPPPLAEANPDAPRELVRFIHRMLEKSPANRPASWREVKTFMEKLKDGTLDDVPPEPQKPTLPQRGKSKFLLCLGIAAAAVLLTLAGALIVLAILTSRP